MTRPSLILALITGAAIAAAAALYQPGLRVVDGDTVDHGFWRWRLANIDAPEIRKGKCPAERDLARQSRDRLKALAAAAGGDFELRVVPGRRDPWRRRVATLSLAGRDAGEILVTEGLARAYDGGMRQGWCP